MSKQVDYSLDRVPLSRLSRRQLLERIARGQERMEIAMSQASEYLTKALTGLDEQWRSLVDRVGTLANEVRDAQGDEAAMTAAADKLTALAAQAGNLALPSEVADPDNPAEAGPLEGDTPAPEPTAEPTPEPDPNLPAAGDGTPMEPVAENPPGVY